MKGLLTLCWPVVLKGGIVSIQVIAYLNPFSQEKTEFEFEQGISVQEIIKKIDTLNAVNTGWRVMIDDEIISDFEKIPEEGQKVYIKVVPGGDKNSAGSGMKAGGWFLAVLGAVMCFTPLAPLGAALLGAGVGLIAGGQALLSIELPKMDSTKTENDPSLRGSRNQMRPYGVVPVLLGRRRIYADLGAKYYTKVEDGSVYLYQLFCAGQKDLAIDENSFKIEETSVVEYSSTKDITKICTQTSPEQSEGTDKLFYIHIVNNASFYYFDKCCNEMQINSELKHTTDSGEDGSVVRTTPDGVTELNVDIFFYNGLGKYDDKGHFDPRSVTVEAYFKKADQPDSAYQILGYWNGSNTISASSHKTLRYSITRDGLVPAAYTVKVTRVTDDSSDTKIVDAVYVGSIRGFKPEPCVRTEVAKKLTLIEVKIKASEKINNVVESLNFVATSILPDTRTAHPFQNKRQSRNPADALRYVLQGSMAQQQLDDSEIDQTPLSRLASWCNTNGYECNAYLTESLRISDLLARIASTCRAEVLRINGKVTVIQDVQQDSEIQLFTPRNSWGYTEVMALGSIPDKTCLKFPDEENGFAENELNVYNTPDGNYKEEPATSQDVTLWGVTNSVQARKIGMYKYAVLKHRFVIVKFSCDFEYLMCRKGDLIKYAGDIALAGLKQGRIVSVQGALLITDEEITMEAGKSYAVRIRHKDGTASLHSLVTSAGSSNELRSAEGDWSQDFEGCLFAFGLSGNETIDLIVTDIQCGDDVTAELTCVEYRPEIFNVDSPDFVLPDYVNKLSPVESVVDPGAVSGWRTFTTYNDSESKPQKPTKDGTENGWHLQQTENSKWVSTKTSATIYTGSWSAPVATGKKVMDLLVPEGEIGNPDAVIGLIAVARENNIVIQWYPSAGEGLKNSIKNYVVQISKDNGTYWENFRTVADSSVNYIYNRSPSAEHYPEREYFAGWKFRVKAVNIYGKESAWVTEAVNTNGYGTWRTAAPSFVKKEADEGGIQFSWAAAEGLNGRLLYGNVTYEVSVYYDGTLRQTISNIAGLFAVYGFDRTLDGYPEKEVGSVTLNKFTATIKATVKETNVSAISTAQGIDYDSYLGWKPNVPVVQTRSSGRTVTLNPVNTEQRYGRIRYDYLINNTLKDGDKYYLPTPTADFTASEDNYRDNTQENVPFRADSPYTQTMPLKGQNNIGYRYLTWKGVNYNEGTEKKLTYVAIDPAPEEATTETMFIGEEEVTAKVWNIEGVNYASVETVLPLPVDTPYNFKVRAVNVSANNITSDYSSPVVGTAKATSAYDVVKGGITATQLAPNAVTADAISAGAVSADKIFVQTLAAITANLGHITDGNLYGNELNYWYLGDEYLLGELIKKAGSFRVGGTEQYLKVEPDPEHDGEFLIELKAGNITLASGTDATFKHGTYIYDMSDERKRLALTPTGMIAQQLVDEEWKNVAKLTADSMGNMVISNTDTLPPTGFHVEKADIYHFETSTNLAESGTNVQNINVDGNLVSNESLAPILLTESSSKCFSGEISKDIASWNGKVMFLSKSDKVEVGTKTVACDGVIEVNPSSTYNVEMKKTSSVDLSKTVGAYLGLTSTQINYGIFQNKAV